jgi:BlaI family transcriptional regulator, penicillinase repressor
MPALGFKLTPVEWEIMETIWRIGGAPSVRDVVDAAYSNGEKAYTTIQTVMNTLEKKGLLKRRKIGMVNFYSPAATRDQMIKTELSLLASRVFQGSVPAMAGFLLNSEKLSLKEIESIKALLDRKMNNRRGNGNDTGN